jgi:hypothetical protein
MFHTKVVEKIKTHIFCSITFFFFFENRAVYEIMWKNIAEPDKPQMIIWRLRSHAGCLTLQTHTQNM